MGNSIMQILKTSYLHNGMSYTNKMASFYCIESATLDSMWSCGPLSRGCNELLNIYETVYESRGVFANIDGTIINVRMFCGDCDTDVAKYNRMVPKT